MAGEDDTFDAFTGSLLCLGLGEVFLNGWSRRGLSLRSMKGWGLYDAGACPGVDMLLSWSTLPL